MRKAAALAMILAGAFTSGTGEAQQPARRWEVRGLDFSPDGVWRRRARDVARRRGQALARGDFAAMNRALVESKRSFALFAAPARLSAVSQEAVSGTLRVPALLVRYKDTDSTMQPAPSGYEQVLFAATGAPYSVRSLYEEMSNGLFSVQGTVQGWITLDSNGQYYTGPANCNGIFCSTSHVGDFIRQAVLRADSAIDYALFDNDGPDNRPNSGDDDGAVDLLWLIHPTLGGECGDTFGMWAHRWVYAGWSQVPLATADPSANGGTIRIENYTLQSGLGGEACDGGAIMSPGVTAHELGHGIGLPDLYPTGADESEGIGEWGLMGSGNWARPKSPAHMESWSLAQLGWIALAPITATGSYTLRPVQTSDTAFIVRPPAGIANPRGEYFLLENRQALQSDTALIAKNKAPGLLVWHLDSAKIVQGMPGNSVNSGAIHGVWLMQADGLNQLRSTVAGIRNRGDAGDPFPGDSARTVFGPRTTPAVTLNATGSPFGGFDLRDVTQLGDGAMSFQVRFGAATVVRASDTTVTVRVRGQPYFVFRYVFDDGDTATVAIDSVQSLNGGRTTATFGAWSNAQPRTHQVQASFAGDTIIAAVALRQRLDVALTGGGSVTTAPAVPVAPSAFVDAGATVNLTATADSGQSFIGWSGDTVAATPVLALPMRRPFAVTANFVPTSALLDQFLTGSGSLTTAQVGLLDVNGNNNGTLDIGDLLAWLDASGVQPGPSLMRRLLERITP